MTNVLAFQKPYKSLLESRKLIISKALRQAQGDINMSGETAGTYFIRCKDNEGRTGTVKVVKE